MKSVVIFFSAITNFKSQLTPLNQDGTRYILIVSSYIFSQLNRRQHDFFEKIYIIDPLTLDTTSRVVEKYIKEVKKENIGLVTNDESCLPIVGQLNDRFKLEGYSEKTILKFIDKILMKNTVHANGLRTPDHALFDNQKYAQDRQQYVLDIEKTFKYPFVLKPVSLYGAASYHKIHNREDWFIHADQANTSHAIYQIEEFIPGTLFHCDAIVKNSQIIFNSISEYLWPISFFKNGYPTGSIWLPSSDPRWHKLNEFHRQVITALAPPNGATHTELFLTEDNEVVFLEASARPSGALVVAMIEKITGINLELAHFELILQKPFNVVPRHTTKYSSFCYVPKKDGQIISLQLPKLKSECMVEWHVKIGELIKPTVMDEHDILLKPENIAATIVLNNPNFADLYDDFKVLKTATFIQTSS